MILDGQINEAEVNYAEKEYEYCTGFLIFIAGQPLLHLMKILLLCLMLLRLNESIIAMS